MKPHSAYTFEELYQKHCNTFSDIQGHLPVLKWLAREVARGCIVELGTRFGVSTAALAAGMYQKSELITVDLVRNEPHVSQLEWLAHRENKDLRFLQQDSRDPIKSAPGIDLLFIDSYHTSKQLEAELKQHAAKVRKWLVLHDTETYRDIGEDGGDGLGKVDITSLGFLGFMHLDAWNGLTVYKRRP